MRSSTQVSRLEPRSPARSPSGVSQLTDPASQLHFQLTSDGTANDLLNVGNTLSITGGTVSLSLLGGATATAGTYHLIDYTTLGGSGSLTLATTSLGTNNLHASLVVNSGNNSIDLVLQGVGLRTWTGTTNSNWNLSTPGNWNPPEFSNGDDVVFDDTPTAPNAFNVILDNANGPVSPNSVTFNNSLNNYTFSGPGSIAGATGIVKNGTGLVTIGNTNTYSGVTQINAGELSISAFTNIGNSSVTNTIGLAGGGLLQDTGAAVDLGVNRSVAIGAGGGGFDVTGANVLTVSGIISGGAAADNLSKVGTGTVVFSNAGNSYANATVISAGTLQLGNNNVIPSASNVTVAGSAFLDLNGKSNAINALAGAGTVTNSASTTASTLTVGSANGGGNFSGSIQDGAGTVAFTKTGSGTQTLSGASTFSGATSIAGGVLIVSGSLSGTASVDVKSTATLGGSGSISTSNSGGVVLENGSFLAPSQESTLSLALGAGTGTLDLSAISGTNAGSLLFAIDPQAISSEVSVTGTLNIGGSLDFNDFNFAQLSAFTSPGQFTLFHSDHAITGSLGANFIGNINGLAANIAISGDDVVLQVVPEPNALTMLAGSLGLALGLQRFRRRRHSA